MWDCPTEQWLLNTDIDLEKIAEMAKHYADVGSIDIIKYLYHHWFICILHNSSHIACQTSSVLGKS